MGEAADALRSRDLALHAAAVTFYAGVAVVPALLVALRVAAAVVGAGPVRDLGDDTARALPDALGAPAAVGTVVDAGVGLTWPGLVVAVVVATLYGEGLRRSMVGLAGARERLVGWRGRVAVLPLLALAPALLVGVLSVAAPLADLFGEEEVTSAALAVYVAFLVDWLALSAALTLVYRWVGPQRPRWRAAAGGGFATGAMVAGFVQGFVLFLALPVDVGAPFGGLAAVGWVAALAGWLYVLHVLALAGYVVTVRLDATAAGDPRHG